MFTLFQFLSRWPLSWLHALGSLAGWLSYGLSPTYRRRLQANAQRAGVHKRDIAGAVQSAGQMLLELPFLWMRPHDRPLGPLVQWVGEDLIEEAHQRGQGLVLLTPHLGCFEVTAQAYAERWGTPERPITVLYSPARKPWLKELVDHARNRPGLATAPATLSGVRQMIRALRQGNTVGLLPDQVPPEGLGEWAPFFGHPAYTMSLASRLVQQTGARMLLIWGERLPKGQGYCIRVSEWQEALVQADGQPVSGACAIVNRAMESLIRQKPDQYLWGYPRYKAPKSLQH